MVEGGGSVRGASLGRRFLARAFDWGVMWGVSGVVFVPIFVVIVSNDVVGVHSPYGDLGPVVWLLMAVFAVTVVAYHALMEHFRGQSLGKILLNIEVRAPDGGRPSLRSAVIRNSWYLLSAVPPVGPVLVIAAAAAIAVSIASSSTGTGLHDRLAGGTSVVQKSD